MLEGIVYTKNVYILYLRNIELEQNINRYIPFIAKHVLETKNINNIPLAGLAIGNGIYDPYIQFRSGPEYAFNLGILDKQEYELISQNVDDCLALASTVNYIYVIPCPS